MQAQRTEATPTFAGSRGAVNKFAIIAVVCAAVALIGSFWGGSTVLAAFGVGAGHVALQQIKERGECGTPLPVAALVVCYALATIALVSGVYYALTVR